jgi:hypothetical protein
LGFTGQGFWLPGHRVQRGLLGDDHLRDERERDAVVCGGDELVLTWVVYGLGSGFRVWGLGFRV